MKFCLLDRALTRPALEHDDWKVTNMLRKAVETLDNLPYHKQEKITLIQYSDEIAIMVGEPAGCSSRAVGCQLDLEWGRMIGSCLEKERLPSAGAMT